jgi:hypothetical protein
MSLAHTQIDDLVLLTQQQFVKRGAFTNLQTDLQDHVAVREMWKGRKRKFEGGEDWEFNAQMDHNYSAKTVGLFETDTSNLTDTMVKGSVPARHVNAHYIYDKREKAFQRGGTGIVDLVMTRYTAMMVSFYELLEELLWSKPTDDSDVKTPFGIKYWITRAATEGFNGANPAGFTSGKGGISQSTYARWANWTAQYTTVSKTDLVRKMRNAARKTKFRSPVSHAEPTLGGSKRGIYMNSDTIGLFEEILEDQNTSLGNDVASKDGRVLFKGTPVTYAPYLDDDSTDPIYMIDWSTLGVGCMAGWENNLTAPYMVPNKHLVSRVDMDASLNMSCTDLRKQCVIYK